jgi:hypothetical protein
MWIEAHGQAASSHESTDLGMQARASSCGCAALEFEHPGLVTLIEHSNLSFLPLDLQLC